MVTCEAMESCNQLSAAWDDGASDCSTVDLRHCDDGCSVGSVENSDVVQSLVIFDWDDTLFPTSWFVNQGFLEGDVVLCSDQVAQLKRLADTIERTLKTAMSFGKVVIVTNAQQGWVELSCSNVMPALMSVLEEVGIVSARANHEHDSQDPSEWKRLAFVREVELLHGPSDELLNVISVGDSLHEQRAAISLGNSRHNCFAKSLKFTDSPSIEDLIEQHDLLSACFVDVAEHNGHLDVEIGEDNSL
jgi:hypothetical protein